MNPLSQLKRNINKAIASVTSAATASVASTVATTSIAVVITIASAFLSPLLTSCEEEAPLYLLKNDLPITFTPQVVSHHNIIRTELDSTFTEFELYAYNTGPNFFDGTTSEPNYIYGQKVSKHPSGNWHYAPLRHWNINPNEKLSFFAFTTPSTTHGALTLKTLYGFPVLHYKMSPRATTTFELLTAKAINQTKSSLRTELHFRQSLSKLVFHLYTAPALASRITLNQVVMTQVDCSADFYFKDFSWKNHQEAHHLSLLTDEKRREHSALSTTPKSAQNTTLGTTISEAITLQHLIIPQENNKQCLKIYLTIDNQPMVYTQSFSQDAWHANRSYHYAIKLLQEESEMTYSTHYWNHQIGIIKLRR